MGGKMLKKESSKTIVIVISIVTISGSGYCSLKIPNAIFLLGVVSGLWPHWEQFQPPELSFSPSFII
jgi:hypothetical protein